PLRPCRPARPPHRRTRAARTEGHHGPERPPRAGRGRPERLPGARRPPAPARPAVADVPVPAPRNPRLHGPGTPPARDRRAQAARGEGPRPAVKPGSRTANGERRTANTWSG